MGYQHLKTQKLLIIKSDFMEKKTIVMNIKIILLLITVFFFSCTNNTIDKVNQYDKKINKEEVNYDTILYNDDNFKLINGLKLEQNIQSDSFNSYQLQDIDNKVFYRINVLNLSNSLNYLDLNKFNKSFRNNYFRSTIKDLEKQRINYKNIRYLNQDAIVYELFTKSDLMKDKESLFKTKFLEILNINKVYTFSVIASPKDIDSVFNHLKQSFSFLYDETSNKYHSIKYNYEVYYPENYSHKKAIYSNIDFKVVKKDGTNFLINVSSRRSEEYGMSGFDYTQEMFEQAFSSLPNIEIINSEKKIINNVKMFFLYSINTNDDTEKIDVLFFNGDYGYAMTAYSNTNDFNKNKEDFIKIIESFRFITK